MPRPKSFTDQAALCLPYVIQFYIWQDREFVARVCEYFIGQSQWFMVTPLPDNQWRFDCKPEAQSYVSDVFAEYRDS